MAARLRQVEETRDLSPVLQREAVRRARELADLLPPRDDLEIRLVLGRFYWYRCLARPTSGTDLRSAVQAFTLCFVAGLDDLPKPLLPHLAEASAWPAHKMLEQAQLSPEPDLLSATVDLWRRILLATPADHPGRAGYQSNLGTALRMRFDSGKADADLEAAIDCFRLATRATPLGHADRAGLLTNLGTALMRRSEHRGLLHDLEVAVARLQEGVDASLPGDPDRPMYLSNLGTALQARFERTGAPADLEAAVVRLREAVGTSPTGHPDRAIALNNLGLALQRRAEKNAATADFDAAIDCFSRAVEVTAPDHPERAGRLSILGIALQGRFSRSGEAADSDASIDCFEKAVRAAPADHPRRAVHLSNLGTALQGRFSRSGAEADLKTSVDCFRKAVSCTPAGHAGRAGYLSHLGAALEILSERTGAREHLEAAVQHHHEAVDTTPPDHPGRGARLTNLGTALQTRFEWSGAAADLDSAVDRHRDAVQTTPVGHPDRAAMLSNLGIALQARFEWTGAIADLESAVQWHQQALDTTPADHPNHARYLSNLADARRIRHGRTGEVADLETAVRLQQQAVDTTPAGHPERAPRLSNLGISLQARSERLGAVTDLRRAVDHLQEAVDTTPGDHPSRATYLSNLGTVLRDRFERTGAPEDLDTAVDRFREAVAATPADHPDLAPRLYNLGNSLQARFRRTRTVSDSAAAVDAWLKALDADSAAPPIRIQAGISAAGLLTQSGEAQRAADVTEAAVRLLPQVVPRRLERGDQQHAIGGFAGLAGAAAARALAAPGGSASERAERALGLLEAGRAVLLSQALDTRSDLTDLSEHHPQLARRFTEQRKQLDQPANTPHATEHSDTGESLRLRQERTARDRHLLAEKFNATLAEIRGLHGFASFALAPTVDELITEASRGPVVVFNVHTDRSDALLLTTRGVTSLALPHLIPRTVVDTVNTFRQALHLARSGADLAEREQAQKTLLTILRWLWDAATGPVLEALGFDHQPATTSGGPKEPWPRVWWAPGGLLSLLPLHAAGHHDDPADDPHRRTVMDRVVSSYTPTVRALRYARERASRQAAGTTAATALIVAMPTTPQVPGRLRFVDAEAAMLQARMPDSVLLREPDPADAPADPTPSTPTKANVLAHLPRCAIAHFACHGAGHPTDPSKSLLLLHDHENDPLTVQSLAPVALDQAKLAYLSACRTAAIDTTNLLDEAIHLTSAFQLAGFPHVIGTLWGIDDRIAVRIAEAFYDGLRSDSTALLDPDQAARALHGAVRRVRDGHDLPPGCDRTQAPSLWAAHLHAGA